MRHLFSRVERLKASEFKEVLTRGKRFASKNLVLVVLKTGKEEKKVGFSLSRKVGHAVVRNRIKRWLREAFRLNQNRFQPGFRLAVLVRPHQVLKNYSDVESAFLALAQKAGLLK